MSNPLIKSSVRRNLLYTGFFWPSFIACSKKVKIILNSKGL
jgi:hypothetical protein